MGWATKHIDDLKEGKSVQFRPRGNSMTGIINSGQLCTVIPINQSIKKGDVVLCRVGRAQYLHLVKSVKGNRYQIGNNKGHINGWISKGNIYGVLQSVE